METNKNLQEQITEVLKELNQLKYAPSSIKLYELKFNQFMKFIKENGYKDIYSEELAAKFLKEIYDYPSEKYGKPLPNKIRASLRCFWLLGKYNLYGRFYRKLNKRRYLYGGDLEMGIIESYVNSIQTSDNSKLTKKLRICHINSFYDFLISRSIKNIRNITPQIISDYAISMNECSPIYTRYRLEILRSFLSYLYTNGLCPDFSSSIPHIKVQKNTNIPRNWEKEEIEKILRSVDRGNSTGKRDFAILLLLIKLDIHISDIAHLKLDNLKWEQKRISFVCNETGKEISHAMSDEIGWAIIDYLRYSRPSVDNKYLFLQVQTPYANMKAQSIGNLLRKYFTLCNMKKDARKSWGPYSFRHSIAKKLMTYNIPLPLLANIMGYSKAMPVYPHLKIDYERLNINIE